MLVQFALGPETPVASAPPRPSVLLAAHRPPWAGELAGERGGHPVAER
jgi:hypothetical protein